jgi:hypothetical protein
MQIYSSKTAAAKIGCSERTISRLAGQNNVGQLLSGRLIFDDSDLSRLKNLLKPVGNPNFSKIKNDKKPAKTREKKQVEK